MEISARRILALSALLVPWIGVASSPAKADPAYRASEIVNHFAPKKTFGVSRSLCIGTQSECTPRTHERPKSPAGFDLKVTFDYNSEHLTKEARANLDQFAAALRDPQLVDARFLVEGHTDAAGSAPFNLDLSTRRASSVVRYLLANGIDPKRLEAKGYGKQKPLIASNPLSPENRRVETRLRPEIDQ